MAQDADRQEGARPGKSSPDPPAARPQKRVRVVVADDEEMIRRRVADLLARHYEVVAVVMDGPTVLDEIRKHRPEVAVIDISMPGMTGIEATRRIVAESGISTRVVILSVHDDWEYVDAAFAAGANGYVVKFAAAKELCPAVEAVLAGESYLSTALRSRRGLNNVLPG